jgi:hypothetical protein
LTTTRGCSRARHRARASEDGVRHRKQGSSGIRSRVMHIQAAPGSAQPRTAPPAGHVRGSRVQYRGPSGGGSIPQEAILDSGMQKVVYVETSDGVFAPRRVTVGTAYGDSSTVTSGLRFGERIVIAGNFLIDSESRLHSLTRSSSSQNPARSVEAGVEVGNLSRRAPRLTRSPSLEGLRVNVPRKSSARTRARVLGAHRGAHA